MTHETTIKRNPLRRDGLFYCPACGQGLVREAGRNCGCADWPAGERFELGPELLTTLPAGWKMEPGARRPSLGDDHALIIVEELLDSRRVCDGPDATAELRYCISGTSEGRRMLAVLLETAPATFDPSYLGLLPLSREHAMVERIGYHRWLGVMRYGRASGQTAEGSARAD